jgi:hypothetical protein
MNELLYTIQPCANGFIVVTPMHPLRPDIAIMEAIAFLSLHLSGEL